MRAHYTFEEIFKLLQEFKDKYEHCDVSQDYKVDTINLGRIVNSIRIGSRKTTDKQKEMLNSIGFVWKTRESPTTFEDVFKLLKEFKDKYGHCNVPQNHKIGSINLGYIVNNIRHGGRKVTDEQKVMLDSIGFVWKTNESPTTFEDVFKLLEEFKDKYGHCNVSQDYKVGTINLGNIVHSIRSGNRKTTNEQKARLDSIGFSWSSSISFEEIFKLLKKFKDEHKHCNVSQNYKVGSISLGRIVRNIRSGDRKTTNEQKAMLDSIGFVWKARESPTTFDEIFKLLQKFKNEYKHCNVSQNYKVGSISLGRIVRDIRSGVRKTTDKQKEMLDSIGFVWKIKQ